MKNLEAHGKFGWALYAWLSVLIILITIGAYAWYSQYSQGLTVTGLSDITSWGIYITSFEFLAGVSAGIMITISIGYLLATDKFQSIMKVGGILATVAALPAMLFVAADIGRIDRILHILLYADPESMLIVDFFALSIYIVFCAAFTLVFVREKGGVSVARLFAGLAIPIAVFTHSVTAWVFGIVMARPLWHTALLAPVFLSSAMVSGVSLLMFTAILTSKFTSFKVSAELTSELARFLGVAILIDVFLILTEVVTVGSRAELGFFEPLSKVLTGPYVTLIWVEIAVPLIMFLLLAYPKTRKSTAVLAIVTLIALRGIWVKRYSMLVSGLSVSPLGQPTVYSPTMIEWAVTIGLFAFGALLFTLGLKSLPIMQKSIPVLAKPSVSAKAKFATSVQDQESAKNIENKSGHSRREFMKLTAGAAVGAAAFASIAGSSILLSKGEQNGQTSPIKEWTMVVDLRRCIGCQACFAACKSENGVPLGIQYTWVETHEEGKYPNTKLTFLPRLCNHCDNPPCTPVCPVNATYKREDGIVVQNVNRCIGCRYCMAACPYEVRSFLWKEPNGAWPQAWNGKAEAKHGFVVKCHGCFHRIEKGLKPACVETCVGGARIFGDLQDPKSEVRKIVDTISTQRLKAYLGTKPMVFYLGLSDKIAERGKKAAGTIIVHQEV